MNYNLLPRRQTRPEYDTKELFYYFLSLVVIVTSALVQIVLWMSYAKITDVDFCHLSKLYFVLFFICYIIGLIALVITLWIDKYKFLFITLAHTVLAYSLQFQIQTLVQLSASSINVYIGCSIVVFLHCVIPVCFAIDSRSVLGYAIVVLMYALPIYFFVLLWTSPPISPAYRYCIQGQYSHLNYNCYYCETPYISLVTNQPPPNSFSMNINCYGVNGSDCPTNINSIKIDCPLLGEIYQNISDSLGVYSYLCKARELF